MSAQLATQYEGDTLVCTVRGDGGTNDNSFFASAVSKCNAWTSGPSIIRISGTVNLTASHDLTGPTSLIGTAPSSQLNFDVTDSTSFISWNETWSPTSETTFSISDATAGDGVVVVDSGTPPVKGDLIVLWSNDQVPGVTPHYGAGSQQSPESIHLVNDVVSSNVYLQDTIPFDLSAAANAVGVVVPTATLDRNITIRDLILNWNGAGDPLDYSNVFRLRACDGITIENVTMTREAPGAIYLQYCTNATIEKLRISGSTKNEGVYGIALGPVNNVVIEGCVLQGCRHAFTTSQGQGQTTPVGWGTIDSVTTGNPGTINELAHGLTDGEQVSITGTPPGGLSTLTPYWVVNSSTNSFQLAATPGGTALEMTDAGSGSLAANGRWGTPLNVLITGCVFISQPKYGTGSPIARQLFDTHPEGYGIVVEGCKFVGNASSPSTTQQVIAQSRSVATKFINNTFEGGDGANIAVRLMADKNEVLNCRFQRNLWKGVQVLEAQLNGTDPDGCVISGNDFDDCYAYAIQLVNGTNHRVTNNSIHNCSYAQGGTPFASESFISVEAGTGHEILGNNLRKDANEHAVDVGQLATTDLTIERNTMTGYGSGIAGIGRVWTISAWDDVANEIDVSFSHGWEDNDEVRFVGSPLPAEVSTGTTYYVIKVSTASFQISTTSGPGAPLPFSASATGATVQHANRAAFETAVTGLNTIDP